MTPLHRAWTDGVIQGLREYAWPDKYGILHVGVLQDTRYKTLSDAIDIAESVWANDELIPRHCRGCKVTVHTSPDNTRPLCPACYRKERGA